MHRSRARTAASARGRLGLSMVGGTAAALPRTEVRRRAARDAAPFLRDQIRTASCQGCTPATANSSRRLSTGTSSCLARSACGRAPESAALRELNDAHPVDLADERHAAEELARSSCRGCDAPLRLACTRSLRGCPLNVASSRTGISSESQSCTSCGVFWKCHFIFAGVDVERDDAVAVRGCRPRDCRPTKSATAVRCPRR